MSQTLRTHHPIWPLVLLLALADTCSAQANTYWRQGPHCRISAPGAIQEMTPQQISGRCAEIRQTQRAEADRCELIDNQTWQYCRTRANIELDRPILVVRPERLKSVNRDDNKKTLGLRLLGAGPLDLDIDADGRTCVGDKGAIENFVPDDYGMWLVLVPVQGSPKHLVACTASKASDSQLISAAHCFVDKNTYSGKFAVVTNQLVGLSCKSHEKFSPTTLVNDVAVCGAGAGTNLDGPKENVSTARADLDRLYDTPPAYFFGYGPPAVDKAPGKLCVSHAQAQPPVDSACGPGHLSGCFGWLKPTVKYPGQPVRRDSGGPVMGSTNPNDRRIVGLISKFSSPSAFVRLSDGPVCKFLKDEGLVTSCPTP